MGDLISVIIPVYNAEKYLRRCIESVLKQTHRNIEIIIVDDGSKDHSPIICDEYARRDHRVRVIHKLNAGPGAAREDGVKVASGHYIAFVDADDYIDENMYKCLINVAKRGFDIVQCGYRKVTTTGELIKSCEMICADVIGEYECALYYASQKNVVNFLWNKIFKAKLFDDVVFPALFAGEDACLLTQLYAKAKNAVTIKEQFYNYVMTPDSLCRMPFSVKKIDNVEAGKFMYNFYQQRFPELSAFSALHICSYAAQCFCELEKSEIEGKSILQEKLLNDFNRFYTLSKNSSVKKVCSKSRVLFIELFNFNRKICSFIFNMKSVF